MLLDVKATLLPVDTVRARSVVQVAPESIQLKSIAECCIVVRLACSEWLALVDPSKPYKV